MYKGYTTASKQHKSAEILAQRVSNGKSKDLARLFFNSVKDKTNEARTHTLEAVKKDMPNVYQELMKLF